MVHPLKYVTAAFIIAVFIFSVSCQALTGEGVIMTGPYTQIVSPGAIVYFRCHARGDSVYWYVNSRDPYPEREYTTRGFSFNYMEIDRPSDELEEHNNTITVEARLSNNNTRIACTASGWIYGQHAYREGTLIIAGRPLRPGVTLFHEHVINNIFTYRLNWSAPFTWDGFPIINYNITVYNVSSGETTTTIKHVNDSGSLNFSHHGTSNGPSCYMLNFSVTASNIVGEGEPMVIQSGHPLVLGEIGDIETVVTFTSNGTPHFWMSFTAPRICSGYQAGSYNITIFDDEQSHQHNIIFEPTDYTQEQDSEHVLIVKEVKTGLKFGKNYTVEVAAESMGIIRSRREDFDTIFKFSAELECSTNSTTEKQTIHVLFWDVMVGILSGVIFGCLIIILAIVVVVGHKRRKRSHHIVSIMPIVETDNALTPKQTKSKPPNLKLQASNPIYEGSMYETPPGENLKNLTSPCSVPCTPLAESASRYVFDFPPKLPPPRKGSVSIQPKLETHDEVDPLKEFFKQEATTSDEYMVMNGGQLKQDKVPESDDTYATAGKWGPEDEYVSVK